MEQCAGHYYRRDFLRQVQSNEEVVPGQSLPTLLNACHATYQFSAN